MADVILKVSVAGTAVLKQRLAGLAVAITNFAPAWPEIEKVYLSEEKQHFKTEGGGHWAPLRPATVAARAKKLGKGHAAHPILEVTGSLRRSLTEPGSKGYVRKHTATSFVIENTLQVGKWNLYMLHAKGTKRMVAREPIFATRNLQGQVKAVLQRYIATQVAKQFGTSIGGQS